MTSSALLTTGTNNNDISKKKTLYPGLRSENSQSFHSAEVPITIPVRDCLEGDTTTLKSSHKYIPGDEQRCNAEEAWEHEHAPTYTHMSTRALRVYKINLTKVNPAAGASDSTAMPVANTNSQHVTHMPYGYLNYRLWHTKLYNGQRCQLLDDSAT